MKKLIAILIIFFISISATVAPSHAQTATYAMVITDDACLYADGGGTIVKYILPKSYFVFVSESFGELARVTAMQGFSDCPQVEGYVKLVDLKFFNEKPTEPYLDLNLTAISDEVLFADNLASKPKTVLAKGSKAKYYGEHTFNNQKYYYVYANGYIGYVRNTCFEEFTVPLHTEYIKLIEEAESSQSNETSYLESTSSSINKPTNHIDTSNIIIIALIIICGLCVLYFIFKPEKLNGKSIYKDDD